VYLLIRKRAVLRYTWRLLAGYRLPAGKQAGILTYRQTKVNKKRGIFLKKSLFRPLPACPFTQGWA
jgi:hypothetical protein